MKLRRISWLTLLLFAGAALAARGQVCSPDAPLRRTLPVNVLDGQGNLVRGLTAADFRASFRGQSVKVLSLDRTTGSRRIVILLDIKDSITWHGRAWALAREAAKRMAAGIPSQDSLALVLFGSGVAHKVEFAQGRDTVLKALAALGPDSHALEGNRLTAPFDGALAALSMFDEGRPGDAIYAVTDGGEAVTKSEFEQVEKALLGSGVRLFVFLLRDPTRDLAERRASPGTVGGAARVSTLAEEVLKRRPWEIEPEGFGRVAPASGGRTLTVYTDLPSGDPPWWRPWVKEQQEAAFDFGLQLFHRQTAEVYLLELELPGELKASVDWKLEVVDARGKRRKEVEVVYPRKLVPCAAAPTDR